VARERNTSRNHGGKLGNRTRLLVAVLTLICLGTAATSCESTGPDRAQVLNDVNASRAQAGLRPLKENFMLDIKADAWARHLRDVCDLSHSNLADGAPSNWMKLGENVGYGGSIDEVHVAYMHSPGHRANILDPTFTSMGAAAVWGTCPDGSYRVFTVQEFMHT
jgi:uncharacterized protein YkwD